jgi:uncharacterized HAD superfamily protein
MTAIAIDLDGTLGNCDHRVHLAQQQRWDEFHSALMDDPVHPDVAWVVRVLSSSCKVIAVTGRNKAFYDLTCQWLDANGLYRHIDHLLMRPDGDWRPDHVLKPELLENHYGTKAKTLKEIAFVLDDRDKVVEGWRNYGLPCWQVRTGGY